MPHQKPFEVEEVAGAQHVLIATRIDHPQKGSVVAQAVQQKIKEKLFDAELSVGPILQLVLLNAYIGSFKFKSL
jgi:hypothetical protein